MRKLRVHADANRPFFQRAMISVIALAACITAAGVASAARVGDFGLIDHEGKYHQLTRYGHQKAIVLISQANGCSLIPETLPRLNKLRQEWSAKEVSFLMLNASNGDTRESIQREAGIYDLDYPILHDRNQLVAETLGISEAGEILVIDPATLTLVFQGPLDERQRRRDEAPKPTPLADAIARTVAGEATSQDTVLVERSPGGQQPSCIYEFEQRDLHAANAPDYAHDVAPILQANCVNCHRQGGIGPFAIDSYQMVRGFSLMIREVLMTRRMPPAQVDPEIGHFTNARYLADADMQTLVHWIDAGAPRGTGGDPLLVEDTVEEEVRWPLGEPDYIVNVPTQQIPATGVIDYINVQVDLPFEEDKWVRAVHFHPGEPKVMHHLLSYVVPDDFEWGKTPRFERRFLEGFAPGKNDAQIFPDNAGVYIPAGHKLSMQLHYTTYGKAVEDSTQLGLYFHDTPPDHEFHNKSVSQGDFVIPAGAVEHKTSQQYVFDKDIVLYGLRPHMHYRGKYARFKVIYPDETTEELLSVPNYNFAWQPTYRLAEPKVLPAGSRVVVSGAFDNSQYNPGNPAPEEEVLWGDQSWEEMFIGYFAYRFVDKDAVRKD
jgi:hypothetical protein